MPAPGEPDENGAENEFAWPSAETEMAEATVIGQSEEEASEPEAPEEIPEEEHSGEPDSVAAESGGAMPVESAGDGAEAAPPTKRLSEVDLKGNWNRNYEIGSKGRGHALILAEPIEGCLQLTVRFRALRPSTGMQGAWQVVVKGDGSKPEIVGTIHMTRDQLRSQEWSEEVIVFDEPIVIKSIALVRDRGAGINSKAYEVEFDDFIVIDR